MGIFSKILGNIKDSKKDSDNENLKQRIQKMDLGEMRLYVNGKIIELKVSGSGLSEIVKKLTLKNEDTGHNYLKDDDQDSKKKKVFDLIVLILNNKKIDVHTLELVQKFLENYDKLIKEFDKENKQIYEKKIKELISITADKISFKSDIADRMRTLK